MALIDAIKPLARRLPVIRRMIAERDDLRDQIRSLQQRLAHPPGHFYSPIPDVEELRRNESRIFGPMPRTIPGIDLRESSQLELLDTFVPFYDAMPFRPGKTDGLRYYFDNVYYSYADAIGLHCMIRHLRPKRVIEVGSGFSSCMILDTNERFLDGAVKVTIIDPYPERLFSLVNDGDRSALSILPVPFQDADPTVVESLEANDILFIDSSHVSKTDSDVNHAVFKILPRLAPGVHVHFHDVQYPFEYPKEWVYRGWAWNEAYLLRAFLQYNSAFSIVLMGSFMMHFHDAFFRQKMPLCLRNAGGSMWIRRNG